MMRERKPLSEGAGFTNAERFAWYRRKWERDHRTSLVIGVILLAALYAAGILWRGWLCILAIVLLPLFMAYRSNKKMAYAEWKVYVEPRARMEEQQTGKDECQ